jgi:hypothetical protein
MFYIYILKFWLDKIKKHKENIMQFPENKKQIKVAYNIASLI